MHIPIQIAWIFFQQGVRSIRNVEIIGPEIWIFAINLDFNTANLCLCLPYLNSWEFKSLKYLIPVAGT